MSWDAWSKLVRLPAASRDSSGDCQDLAVKRKSSRLSSLEYLPAEILGLIFDGLVPLKDGSRGKHKIVTAIDVLALGLTSSTMYAHCVQHINSAFSRGPWIDTEIACIGNLVTHLPPGFTEKGFAPKITWTGSRRSHRRQDLLETRRWNCSAWSKYGKDEFVFGREIWLDVFDSISNNAKSGRDEVVKKKMRQILWKITAPACTVG